MCIGKSKAWHHPVVFLTNRRVVAVSWQKIIKSLAGGTPSNGVKPTPRLQFWRILSASPGNRAQQRLSSRSAGTPAGRVPCPRPRWLPASGPPPPSLKMAAKDRRLMWRSRGGHVAFGQQGPTRRTFPAPYHSAEEGCGEGVRGKRWFRPGGRSAAGAAEAGAGRPAWQGKAGRRHWGGGGTGRTGRWGSTTGAAGKHPPGLPGRGPGGGYRLHHLPLRREGEHRPRCAGRASTPHEQAWRRRGLARERGVGRPCGVPVGELSPARVAAGLPQAGVARRPGRLPCREETGSVVKLRQKRLWFLVSLQGSGGTCVCCRPLHT